MQFAHGATSRAWWCALKSRIPKLGAKNVLNRYSSLPKSFVTDVFSELNQYRTSIGAVSDQYAHIFCIRSKWHVFVALIQRCRTDTDTIYSSVSDPLPKSSIAFLGTDLDQIGYRSGSDWFQFWLKNVRFWCEPEGGADKLWPTEVMAKRQQKARPNPYKIFVGNISYRVSALLVTILACRNF